MCGMHLTKQFEPVRVGGLGLAQTAGRCPLLRVWVRARCKTYEVPSAACKCQHTLWILTNMKQDRTQLLSASLDIIKLLWPALPQPLCSHTDRPQWPDTCLQGCGCTHRSLDGPHMAVAPAILLDQAAELHSRPSSLQIHVIHTEHLQAGSGGFPMPASFPCNIHTCHRAQQHCRQASAAFYDNGRATCLPVLTGCD